MGAYIPDDDLLAALQAVADRAPSPLTIPVYRHSRAQLNLDGQRIPDASTIAVRFGGWSRALAAAGLPTPVTPRREWRAARRPAWRNLDEAEVVAAVHRWAEGRERPLLADYRQASREDRSLPPEWLLAAAGGWKAIIRPLIDAID